MTAQYSPEVYKQLSLDDLNRRFTNLEFLAKIYSAHRDEIKRSMEDFEYGQQTLKDWRDRISSITDDMSNIIIAIQMKQNGG